MKRSTTVLQISCSIFVQGFSNNTSKNHGQFIISTGMIFFKTIFLLRYFIFSQHLYLSFLISLSRGSLKGSIWRSGTLKCIFSARITWRLIMKNVRASVCPCGNELFPKATAPCCKRIISCTSRLFHTVVYVIDKPLSISSRACAIFANIDIFREYF